MRIFYKIWIAYIRFINSLRFKKLYSKYKIVPFGCYCLPRVITKHNRLKPSKKQGEESFPFDLCFSKFDTNVKLLCSGFDGFYDGFEYDTNDTFRKCWSNRRIDMVCNHDTMPTLDEFKQRYDNRIKNLYDIIKNQNKHVFFLIADKTPIENDALNLFIHEIKKYRHEQTFTVIIINQSNRVAKYTQQNVFCLDLSNDIHFAKINTIGDWEGEISHTKTMHAMLFNSKINRTIARIIRLKLKTQR